MSQVETFDKHTQKYEAWFDKYEYVYQSELKAISDHFKALPENITGIEVGLGTGMYAQPLGIKEGIEPSESMRVMAVEKGIEVMDGVAELLPYKDLAFDFVLFVTICHLDDLKQALREVRRVLKHDGSVIIGFIDKDSPVGENYEAKKITSTFYKEANFYTVEKVESLLKEVGFKNLTYNQTLFGGLDEIDEIQIAKDGYGEGSFVVVRATK